jgi:hypothetical protein
MRKAKAKVVAVHDRSGNEIILPPIHHRPDQPSQRQFRREAIPLIGPRTGSHPMAEYDPHLSLMNGLRHFGHYIATQFAAQDNAPVAFHSRIDGALTHLEMR